jgi:hypothetical protein
MASAKKVKAMKKVTFANDHGKSLTKVKLINKEGKSAKVTPLVRKFKPAAVNAAALEKRRKLAKEQAKKRVIAAEYEVQQVGIQEKKVKNVEKAAKEMYGKARKELQKAQLSKTGNKTALVSALSQTATKSMVAINQLAKHQAKLNEVKQDAMMKLNIAKNHLKAQKKSG